MYISSGYDSDWYSRYYSQIASAMGQQSANQITGTQNSDDLLQALGASDESAQNTTRTKPKDPLDSLVEAGTITEEQKQAIADAFNASRMVWQTKEGAAAASDSAKNPLQSLVDSGVITEDQAASVKETLDSAKGALKMPPPPPPPAQGEGDDPMKSALDSLVEDGVISSDQEESIMDALESSLQANSEQEEEDTSDTAEESETNNAQQLSYLESVFASAIKAYRTQSDSYDYLFGNSDDQYFKNLY